MSERFTREQIRARLADTSARHRPVLVTTAGIGLSAKFSCQGGSDMIAVTSASVLAMDGHHPLVSLLPYGNANELVLRTVRRIASQVKKTPLLAGICATDPTTDLTMLLEELAFYKVSGVFNAPSVGLLGGDFKRTLEKAGIRYEAEVEALQMAAECGMYTMGCAYNSSQAVQLAEAGVDGIICDLGHTAEPDETEASPQALESAVGKLQRMTRAVRTIDSEITLLIHGGPLNSPEAARVMLPQTGACGLFLASAVERIPVEQPLVRAAQEFKEIGLNRQGDERHG